MFWKLFGAERQKVYLHFTTLSQENEINITSTKCYRLTFLYLHTCNYCKYKMLRMSKCTQYDDLC